MTLFVVPQGLTAFSDANSEAGDMISGAGSADVSAMVGAAAAVVGPIGVPYLAAYVPAQGYNLARTLMVGGAASGDRRRDDTGVRLVRCRRRSVTIAPMSATLQGTTSPAPTGMPRNSNAKKSTN